MGQEPFSTRKGRFDQIRARLPEPTLVEIRPGLRLNTLHLPGLPPPLVFIHGGLGNLWDAYMQLDAFHGRYELLAYDLAGNGASEDRPQHTLQGHLLDLADLLAVVGIERPLLVAWSYGVALALAYAKRHPVRALMLTGGAAYGMTPAWEYPFLRLALALRLYRLLPGDWIMRPLAQQAAFHSSSPDYLVGEMLQANPLPRRRSAWEAVTGAFWGYQGLDGLQQIEVPAYVVHGPADQIVPMERARVTARLLPQGHFFELEESGHAAPVEQAGAYNRLLEQLIVATQTAS